MKGDFSRDTFDRQHRFARVLMQQGRVLLDADWNEQTSILLHHLRTLAADLIGPHGGPAGGFEVLCEDELECDFRIGWGHYYVDGILCENHPPRRCPPEERGPAPKYSEQADYPPAAGEEKTVLEEGDYLVYLDVWERHLTHLEVDHIRELALGGPDTAARSRVVWQVKAAPVEKRDESESEEEESCADLLDRLVLAPRAEGRHGHRCLRARARVEEPSDDPCIIPPEARYRGAENQLYRVEIHDGGEGVGSGEGDAAYKDAASFKWSRDNGSVVFGIRSLQGTTVFLDSLGPDERRGLKEGDWVEIVDDVSTLRFEPRPLAKVEAVDRVELRVTLAVPGGTDLPVFEEDETADQEKTTHPLLRRWDQGSDVLPVVEGTWLDLEDGVQVWFEPGGRYRTGDHWLIPARTATGDVLWPTEGDDPRLLPPDGIEHHYAPLARIGVGDNGEVTCDEEYACRCTFQPLCPGEVAFGGSWRDRPARPGGGRRRGGRPLREIDGVGDTFAARLEAAGIEDSAAVARMDPSELAGILSPPEGRPVREELAATIIANAKRATSG